MWLDYNICFATILKSLLRNFFYVLTVCVFQCQPTALLRASGSEQGGQMALSGLFLNHTPLGQTTLRVGRVSVQCTVGSRGQGDCMCNSLCRVIVLCEMMMKGREKVKPGAGSQPALLKKHQGGGLKQALGILLSTDFYDYLAMVQLDGPVHMLFLHVI